MRQTPKNLLQGQAGVYRVASKLCLLGFNPHFPAVDIGADMVIDGGIRIQVKASHMRMAPPYPNGAYWFKLGGNKIENQRRVWRNVTFSDFCDFVIFWGIEQDRFWIVPPVELDAHQCLTLGPEIWHRDVDMDKLRELHESGMKQEDIATILGTTQMTVSRRLRAIHVVGQHTLAKRVRQCENNWGIIQSYLDLIQPSNLVTTDIKKEIVR